MLDSSRSVFSLPACIVNVFKNRSEARLRDHAQIIRDRSTSWSAAAVVAVYGNALIFLPRDRTGLRKTCQRMQRVLLLPVQVRGRRSSHSRRGCRRLDRDVRGSARFGCVAFGKICVGKSQCNGSAIRTRELGLIEVGFGEIETCIARNRFPASAKSSPVTGEEGDSRASANPESDLTFGFFVVSLMQENLSYRQANADAISSGTSRARPNRCIAAFVSPKVRNASPVAVKVSTLFPPRRSAEFDVAEVPRSAFPASRKFAHAMRRSMNQMGTAGRCIHASVASS